MAPSRIRILYAQPSATFISGQLLSGHVVVIDCDKSFTINEISLRVSGLARVDWTEKNNDECYSNYEDFIDARMSIYRKEINSDTCYSPGGRRFPFTFQLPVSLPSTFISPYGFVHYYCKAIVHTTEINCLTMSSKIKVQEPFNIINDIDVNSFPHMNRPATVYQSQRLPSVCCLSRGTLSVFMTINKSAFVVGESVAIDYSILNRSSVPLVAFDVALVQKVLYTANFGNKKCDNRNIANVLRSTEIPPHKDVQGHVTLSVPSVPPNSLGICKSISVSYHALLSVGEISSCNPTTKLYFEISHPILIGTIRRHDVTLPFY